MGHQRNNEIIEDLNITSILQKNLSYTSVEWTIQIYKNNVTATYNPNGKRRPGRPLTDM